MRRRGARRAYGLGLGAATLLVGCCFGGGGASATQPGLVTGKGVAFSDAGHSLLPYVTAPNDPLFKYQWNLSAIQIPGAWAVSRGAGATVAVLDTGVAYENHGVYRRAPDLAGTHFVAGWDFIDNDAHPDDVPAPGRRTHGTQIAGIIAATAGNGIGGAGVAPEAAIMPIRVLHPDLSGSARTIARGLRFAADHGANVANLSIAGPSGSPALRAAIDYAWARGVTVVASAGNDGRASVGFPAAYPKVISVGAVRQDRRRAYYSNYGRALDLVAPGGAGEEIDSGYGPGDGVVAQTLRGTPSQFCFCFTASTSAAAAHVSGVAALLIGSGRARSPGSVRSALLSGAQDLGPRGWDPEYGAGLVQAWDALTAAALRAQSVGLRGVRRSAGPSWSPWWVVVATGLGIVGGLWLLRRASRRRGS